MGLLYADDLIHVVGRGETVYSISRFYSVSADDLMRANKITDPSRLQAGSRLIIPSSAETAVSGVQALTDYRVVRGDTLFSIARTNGISLQTLLDINKFSSSHILRVGEVIKIPGRQSGNSSAVYSMRWPVTAKDIAYMTGQMGVVVEGEHNESVRSLTQGQVISAGPWRKFGRVVIVETTAGYLYMYGGCESLSVNVGDRISPGTEVGKLGINTVSNKPQLFFMVFRSDTPIDPALAPRT
ncbi:MAG: LysM peptidoglycan-binding domain-containing protein [Treponema sp.]|nr:LysM peptidoglycan-binding domain-containing protein [Treponema sp.]